jgi:hypothetical protein
MRKRLPLTGTYNTRPVTGALTGALAIADIAIADVAICDNINQGSSKDFRALNCHQITVTDKVAQSKRLYLVKRPGFAANTTPRAGHIGNAIHVWTGQGTGTKVMSAFGNTNFKLFDGTTDKGDGTGKATFITETSVSGTPTIRITSDDNSAWWWQDGGTLTKITDAQFPSNDSRTITGPISALDGYDFVMDITGRIYNSDLNSVSAYTGDSYVTANSIPDVGVAAIRHRNTIIGFCKEHFDVFRNAGNPTGSPLGRVEELSQLIGLVNQHAVDTVRDTVYFVGSTKGANIALYSYNGGQIQKHSTPEVEMALAIAGPSNISITKLGFYGRHYVVVSASSSTYAYCIEEDNWGEWTGAQFWYKADGVVSGSATVNYAISNDSTGGKVFVLNPANLTYQDDGTTFAARIQTAKWDDGNNQRKFMSELSVVADMEDSESLLQISWSDNDYMSSTTARTVDLSDERPKLTRCGSFRRRSFLLAHISNTPMRIEALEANVEQGNN